MNKKGSSGLIISMVLIGFWLFLPIPFMIHNLYTGDALAYDSVNTDDLDNVKTPGNVIEQAQTLSSATGLYFQMVFLWIPDLNVYLNYFLIFLRVISLLAIIITVLHGG